MTTTKLIKYIFKKKLQEPKSLYSITIGRVLKNLINNIYDDGNLLPFMIRKKLLLECIRCRENYVNIVNKTIPTIDFTKSHPNVSSYEFSSLMFLDQDEYTNIFPESCAMEYCYYGLKKYCRKCAIDCGQIDANYMKKYISADKCCTYCESDVKYDILNFEEIAEVVFDENNWCSRCITTPLFRFVLENEYKFYGSQYTCKNCF